MKQNEPTWNFKDLDDIIKQVEKESAKTEMLEGGVMQVTSYSKGEVVSTAYLGKKSQELLDEKIREGFKKLGE